MASYTVAMNNQTIVADATLVIVHTDSTVNSAGSNIIVYRAYVNQIGTETSDQLGVIVGIKASAFGTYSSTTPSPHWLGGTASSIGVNICPSCRFAAVSSTASGMPFFSTRRWYFEPGRPRSVGFGPVSAPPFLPEPRRHPAQHVPSRFGRPRPTHRAGRGAAAPRRPPAATP